MGDEECGVGGEESSWTFYIEGFMCDHDDRNAGSDIDHSTTPSLVSDAASAAVVKKNRRASHVEMASLGFSSSPNNCNQTTTADHHHHHHHLIRSLCKQSSFKKQKTKVIPAAPSMDFDLEDTASSPVNSPKVSSYMNDQFMMNQKGKGKIMEYVSEFKRNSFGKGSGGGVFAVERDIAHAHAATNYADFKKRTSTP
ncbi:UNVERIFIED_CONTAM: hypothetical protein Sangu_0942400 [Sesamum angustifolium]|uniref:Uncharacterized protein n=1 Tax=Sesamum angustifolium TaxID=2727405 RepID=A0AAW2PDE0_9LAMI